MTTTSDKTQTSGSSAKIGRRMAELRKAKGFTQQVMAEQLNISLQHYSNIERGRRKCNMDLFIAISKILSVHGNELLRDYLPIEAPIMEFSLGKEFQGLTPEQQNLYYDLSEALISRLKTYEINTQKHLKEQKS